MKPNHHRPDLCFYSEVFWEGPGRYAWGIRADGVQRWYRVGKPDTPISLTLTIVAQQGLCGLTWADKPEELNTNHVEILD